MVLSLILKQILCVDNLKKWNNNTFIIINKGEWHLFKKVVYPWRNFQNFETKLMLAWPSYLD
jgi:hypothetical protein